MVKLVLGGFFNGYAAQLIGGGSGTQGSGGPEGGSERELLRFKLREAWNGSAATGTVKNLTVAATPFRAVNNAGDLLCRQYYTSGGSTQISSIRGVLSGWKTMAGAVQPHPDKTGIPSATCNGRYVYDSSDYITFKKLQATNRNYNNSSFGGNLNSGSQSAFRASKRFF
jgi:hypothetical protein